MSLFSPLANDMDDMIWAVVPMKRLPLAKRRLSSLLPARARAHLAHQMLRHLLQTLGETEAIARTLVISQDPMVRRLAIASNATPLIESSSGLNAALTQAARLAGDEASHLLILPGDLPFIEHDDVVAMVRQAPLGAICSDRRRQGTNALLIPTGYDFRFQFGPGSFSRHCRQFERRGIPYRTVQRPGLMFDLDTPSDWQRWQAAQATV